MDEGQAEQEWWSAREVARFLSISLWEIEKLRRSGTLSATKRWPLGRRYSSQSVMGYFESLAVEAPSPPSSEPFSPEESQRAHFAATLALLKEVEVLAQARQEQEGPWEGDDYDMHPLIKIVNAILSGAIDQGASDIYFEPFRRNLRVRFRVQGLLQDIMPIPRQIQSQLTRRVMVMADMDMARLFVPQVGSIRLKHNNRDWNLRVTAIPSLRGHTVNVRLLSGHLHQGGLEMLGMLPELFVPLEDALVSKGGLFIFAGTSGSGATTTVAACLHYLDKIERAIYTIEQPVEYELPGITQIQLNPFCGHTLAKALQTVLRTHPDVLFLGSIHDSESAHAAMEAAEVGITVLTTMRCTNIPTVFTLLERYGVAPQVQARLVQVVVNQCLARSQDSETQQAFFEAAWIGSNPQLRELVEKRAPQPEIQHVLRYWSDGMTLEEQLVNPRSREDS